MRHRTRFNFQVFLLILVFVLSGIVLWQGVLLTGKIVDGKEQNNLNFQYPQKSYDEIDMARVYGQWVSVEHASAVSLTFLQQYAPEKVVDVRQYSITSADDPAYHQPQRPKRVGYRWRALHAPLPDRKNNLTLAYRVFLELPAPLKSGVIYTVRVQDIGISPRTLSFRFDDQLRNDNIKINQVGYLPNAQKYGYLGEYGGTLGPLSFDTSRFEIRDAATGAVVFTGRGSVRRGDERHTGHALIELNFSELQRPGRYIVHVPGVGVSYPFRIGNDVYHEIFGVSYRGAYHARSGTALREPFTRFVHDSSHMRDAVVMQHAPLPTWFTSRYGAPGTRTYYPTTLSGKYLNTTRGHYDAGDYGKYTVNGAYFVGYILAGYEAFPDRLRRDDLGVPESGNGIPDLLEEAKWELDWLENMQDPEDGGVFCIVKPDGAIEFYENRRVDDARNAPRLLYPKDTICTGAYAAALAKAARSPLIKQYYPGSVSRYTEKAERAWRFLEKTPGHSGWHHYGTMEDSDDKSLDERTWAALELYGVTKNSKYREFFMTHHDPAYARWGWIPLFASSGLATLSCAFMDVPNLDASMRQRCKASVIHAGEMHVRDSTNRAYRLSMSNDPLDARSFGWFFPQERAYQLVFAHALSADQKYLNAALFNWDYILGANPSGYSHITGIGAQQFREPVHTQSVFDGIEAPVSGIPIGLASSNSWIESYGSRISSQHPGYGEYPLLLLPFDGYNVVAEFIVPDMAMGILGAAYFAHDSTGNQPPLIQSLGADIYRGPVPLSVKFTPRVSDRDGRVVSYRWDFDDGSFSSEERPQHVFRDIYRQYHVALTIRDDRGAERTSTMIIEGLPATWAFNPERASADKSTLALYSFDEGSQSAFPPVQLRGDATYTSDNLLWMAQPTGKALRFFDIGDRAVISFEPTTLARSNSEQLVLDAKLYVREYRAYSRESSVIIGLYQDWNQLFVLRDETWAGRQLISYDSNVQTTLLSGSELDLLLPKLQWHHVMLVSNSSGSSFYLNGALVARTLARPMFKGNAPVQLMIGGFDGWIDEVRIGHSIPDVRSQSPLPRSTPTAPIPDAPLPSAPVAPPIIPPTPISPSPAPRSIPVDDSQQVSVISEVKCGDALCEYPESCSACADDCGICATIPEPVISSEASTIIPEEKKSTSSNGGSDLLPTSSSEDRHTVYVQTAEATKALLFSSRVNSRDRAEQWTIIIAGAIAALLVLAFAWAHFNHPRPVSPSAGMQ